MVSMNDVPVNDLIEKTAESLKQIPEIKAPEWALFVKTGMHKERPPIREDWWHIRSAAVLKSVAKLGPIGVAKLRTKYGGRKNRGHKPDRFYKGSGNIIRKILQQLEKAQLVKKVDKDIRKGRVLAPKGMSLLNKAAYEVSRNLPKKVEPAPVQVKTGSKPVVQQPKAAVKPETKEVAKTKPVAKPAEAPKAQPKVAAKPKTIPKEQPKVAEKPAVPAEKPKVVPKEQPKETPKPAEKPAPKAEEKKPEVKNE